MMPAKRQNKRTVAIACGGTGGHLFPGIAVGKRLVANGCRVILLVSSKDVDQLAASRTSDFGVLTLPAIGFSRGSEWQFFPGFIRSFCLSSKSFRAPRPQAVLGMGGFTSAPPVLAGKRWRATTFLHESNSV